MVPKVLLASGMDFVVNLRKIRVMVYGRRQRSLELISAAPRVAQQ